MKILVAVTIGSLLCINCAAATSPTSPKPEFHRLPVPIGKSAHSLKPQPEVRVADPIVLTTSVQRLPGGSLHLHCDHEHSGRRLSAEAQP
jgi:hypothetical protein